MNKNRKMIIAGNWKMNKNAAETKDTLYEMAEKIRPTKDMLVVLCLPAINIPTALSAVENTDIVIGAQNCHWAKSGAFTGEISAEMLKSFGIKYSIIGHSERRQYFGETDNSVNMRALTCIENGITPIICIGENILQRESGMTKDVIKNQLMRDLSSFTKEDILKSIIAYEPIWAIGTGKTATNSQAEDVCSFIRNVLKDMFGACVSEEVNILYGGSMNSKNAKGLLKMQNIDGGLIGGASLNPDDFAKIVEIGEAI